MLPIGDDEVRGGSFGFVNFFFIVINVIAFLFQVTMDPNAVQDFVMRWGAIPTLILQGTQLITLFTSMFLHGGWLHLLGNMVFLWIFGDNIEAVLGHVGYFIFYIAGGLAATAAHIFFNPDSSIPSVGASGAISAVLGAYIVMFPRSQVRTLIFLGFWTTITRVSAVVFLGIWFAMQLFSGITSIGNTAQSGGVAVWAHIGGFVFGVILGFLFKGKATRLNFRWPQTY